MPRRRRWGRTPCQNHFTNVENVVKSAQDSAVLVLVC
jgi:hypothetical protein